MGHRIYFLCLLRAAFCLTGEPYKLHLEEATFDQAVETCQKNGYLTDMAEEEEVAKIISHISDRINHAGTLNFWVGLRKSNLDCVLDYQPLRGFKWTVSDSSDTKVSEWMAEPTNTCSSVLCGLLTVEYTGKKVTKWGWNGSSCKENHPFICKVNQQVAEIEPECDKPHIFNSREILPVKDNPSLLEVHCMSNDSFYLHCSSGTKEWTVGSGSGEITQICLACNPGYIKNDVGSCVDLDECAEQPCEPPLSCVNTQGSYVCECDATMGYVPTEDSMSCKKLPLATDAPAASSTTAFQFLPPTDPSPKASDGKGSPPTSPPTSPTTTTTTTGAGVVLENSESGSRIWIPVLAAVLSLVFLAVIIAIIVKFCLRKRSKTLSKEQGGKSKETVVLKAADSMEEINQKDIV